MPATRGMCMRTGSYTTNELVGLQFLYSSNDINQSLFIHEPLAASSHEFYYCTTLIESSGEKITLSTINELTNVHMYLK